MQSEICKCRKLKSSTQSMERAYMKFKEINVDYEGGRKDMSTDIKLGRLIDCTFAEALMLRNRGFEQYYSDMTTTMEGLIGSLHNNSIRPEHSVVAYADGKPVGFVFVGIKTVEGKKLAWNGGTGVFPEYRGRGIAKQMMIEVNRILKEEEVDRATLEVVTKNAHAIAAYEKGGFHIVDHLIGLTFADALPQPFYSGPLPSGYEAVYGKPAEAKRLSFYREKVAWDGMWHNLKHGESLIIRDDAGNAAGYALFVRSFQENGELSSVDLRQCEVDPAREDQEQIFRMLLAEVYGPYEHACRRSASNLITSTKIDVQLLKEAGFETRYEQYLMILDKDSGS